LKSLPVIEIDGRRGMSLLFRRGIRDLISGFDRRELWIFMGWREVRKHYQRSIIGPFWLTLNMGILVGGLGVLYSQIFKQDIREYLPFLATGFILWAVIGSVINDSCVVYSSAAAAIRQVQLPLSVQSYQFVWRNFITFLHNFTIYILVALVFGIWPGLNGLLFFPALLMIMLNGFFISLLLGPLSARFRDIPPIVASFTQIFFFMTPIFWSPQSMPDRALFLILNPFYHFIEIARQPLLGGTGSLTNWVASLAITVILGIVSSTFFCRYRSRIAYWV
jgi:ABC-2 type transport system permease protein